MIFKKKKETTEAKIARAAGRTAGKAVRTGRKAAATARAATSATRKLAAQATDAVSRTRAAVKAAAARRRRRKTMEKIGGRLKTAGKAVAVAGLTAAAAAGISQVAKRRRA